MRANERTKVKKVLEALMMGGGVRLGNVDSDPVYLIERGGKRALATRSKSKDVWLKVNMDVADFIEAAIRSTNRLKIVGDTISNDWYQ